MITLYQNILWHRAGYKKGEGEQAYKSCTAGFPPAESGTVVPRTKQTADDQ